jgi:hypothetical protein
VRQHAGHAQGPANAQTRPVERDERDRAVARRAQHAVAHARRPVCADAQHARERLDEERPARLQRERPAHCVRSARHRGIASTYAPSKNASAPSSAPATSMRAPVRALVTALKCTTAPSSAQSERVTPAGAGAPVSREARVGAETRARSGAEMMRPSAVGGFVSSG